MLLSHALRARKPAIQFVGYATAGSTFAESTFTVSLTSLTGGIGSSPAAGDLILVLNATSGPGDDNVGTITSGYTEIFDLYANDTYDTNLSVSRKIAVGNETSVTVNSPASVVEDNLAGAVGIVYVWRGVNTTTPLDVTSTTTTGINGGRPDVPAITPVTPGAIILGFGAGSIGSGTTALTASSMSNVAVATQAAGTYGVSAVAAAYTGWTSGVYDMAQFGGGSTSIQQSWCAGAVALRPLR